MTALARGIGPNVGAARFEINTATRDPVWVKGGILALALGNLVNLTNPERVIVGGWVGLCLMQSRRAQLEAQVRAAALERPGSQFTLELCRFEGDSVALGAALLPLQRLIDGPMAKVTT